MLGRVTSEAERGPNRRQRAHTITPLSRPTSLRYRSLRGIHATIKNLAEISQPS
jgi:hypothetical protein